MLRVQRNDPCPCGSGQKLKRCCGPMLDGQPAPTPEACMRSRFSAYVTGHARHLWRSAHETCPSIQDEAQADYERGILAWCRQCRYFDLQILHAPAPDGERGEVHFRCRYTVDGQTSDMEEVSSFIRDAAGWRYLGPVDRQGGRT